MRQIFSTNKGVDILDIPRPIVDRGYLLVQTYYSFISTGTELRAINDVENKNGNKRFKNNLNVQAIKKLRNYLKNYGLNKTVDIVRSTFSSSDYNKFVPLGYSCSGRVVSVGKGVTDYVVGDIVACAGNFRATHSEYVLVPENLVSIIPYGCDIKLASSVALGAIGLHSVRQCESQIGEKIGIIGLGLMGQICSQLLKLTGARVIGFDIKDDRIKMAEKLGIDKAADINSDPTSIVDRFTNHMGVDKTLITASSNSEEIFLTASKITRNKGLVVVLGKVPLIIPWSQFYNKELNIVSSRAYGPGRYDENYEVRGVDYPFAYVRWTEKRNMNEYLRLISENKIDLNSFTKEISLEECKDAYKSIVEGDGSIGTFINYGVKNISEPLKTETIQINKPRIENKLNIGLVGAGRFMFKSHVNSLKKLSNKLNIVSVVSRTGSKSYELAKLLNAENLLNSYDDLLNDKEIDVVIIGTRNHHHAKMALKALKAGKHVFVEKPLAINEKDLIAIEKFFYSKINNKPILFTGYNRRFSVITKSIIEAISLRDNPLTMNYIMNTEYMSSSHWMKQEKEGGGRNLSEACHVYDLFTYLVNSEYQKINVNLVNNIIGEKIRNENFVATISFNDGSIGNFIYSSMGSLEYPKDNLTIISNEKIITMENFISIKYYGNNNKNIQLSSPDKGLENEFEKFIEALETNNQDIMPIWHQIQSCRIALEIDKIIKGSS